MGWFPRLRFAFTVIAIIVIVGSAFRYGFLLLFNDGSKLPTNTLLQSFYVGLKFDIRLAVLVVIPFLALAWIPLLNPSRSRQASNFWSIHFSTLVCLFVLILMTDFGHYGYLQDRLNASAFRFMKNPLISMQMVWQTYSVIPAMVILILAGASTFLGLRRLLITSPPATPRPSRAQRRIAIAAATVILIAGLYGKFSYYPLRWSDAYFTTASFPANLAINPVLNTIDTLATAEVSVESLNYLQENYAQLASYLGVEEPDSSNINLYRTVTPTPLTSATPNVVVIMMESFAAHLTGFYGNPLKASPEFDRIAEDGLVFMRYYTPSVGTAHGVYTMLTGIPDVSLNRTASRNPQAVRQHIILNDFDGYEKFYFLGGSANWANIRALLQSNINGLKLYEEGDFPNSPRTDVWGISDLHLFEEANRVIRETRKPFFALIHLSGNHRPYTIPDDNRGFETVTIDEHFALENGFDKEDGFNSFRFMDHSLGFFMRLAQEEAYFANTIFVLTADNGEIGKVPGPLHREEEPRLSYHHAPLVIFGPQLSLNAQRIDALATQMDLLPTIAGAAGIPAKNVALGRNLLDPDNSDGYAFIHRRWGTGSELVILNDDYMYTSKRGVLPPVLERYQQDEDKWQMIADEAERAKAMETHGENYYQAAKYLMFGERK